jgi:3-methyladenine DNA glycosylase AlkC
VSAETELRTLFNPDVVRAIARRVSSASPDFTDRQFVRSVSADLPPLSLLQRSTRIAEGLRDALPGDYPQALAILRTALGPPPPPSAEVGATGVNAATPDNTLSSFTYLPYCNFVSRFGLDHLELSLDALEHFTCFFSAEFDIRPFLLRHPAPTLARLNLWTRHPDPRVRRLASEGSRPRLPWGIRLQPFIRDPFPTLALLESLRNDPDAVVRRSVANHLNDISRDHPEVAVAVARRWLDGSTSPQTLALVRHALRTRIKSGDAAAMALLGYSADLPVRLERLKVSPKRLTLGGTLAFEFTLVSTRSGRVVVDYAIHHRRARGQLTAKVFKLKSADLHAGKPLTLSARHAIRPITTRRYYPGTHRLEILVSGRPLATATFTLSIPR